MADACPTCGHERSDNRCWRLTCPENGAPHGLLDLVALPVPDLAPDQQTLDRVKQEIEEVTGIGEKVQHVLRAKNTGNHHCHWPGCPLEVKPAVWGCKKHWFMLPDHIRRRIWQTYAPGQEQTKTPSRAYVEAAQAAQAWIAAHHPPERKLL